MKIYCKNCDGFYKLRESKYGLFAGCSNYPKCKSKMSIPELVLEFIHLYGINIYKWDKTCWKCGKSTPVYSYYLDYELESVEEMSEHGLNITKKGFNVTVGLGDLAYIDNALSNEVSSIKPCFSKTTQSQYIANTCVHCGALQGRNYVVDDPHEIIAELWENHSMKKFLYKTIKIDSLLLLRDDIFRLFS
jgi:ssDNA-binding Zn-finger/Zn-ribbon topoisomerase 1